MPVASNKVGKYRFVVKTKIKEISNESNPYVILNFMP